MRSTHLTRERKESNTAKQVVEERAFSLPVSSSSPARLAPMPPRTPTRNSSIRQNTLSNSPPSPAPSLSPTCSQLAAEADLVVEQVTGEIFDVSLAARNANTNRAYKSRAEDFKRWCEARAFDEETRFVFPSPLPLTQSSANPS